jgi:hypothetical protein
MTEEEFIQLLNKVARLAKPFDNGYTDVVSMSDKLADSGLDSLDMLLTGVYLCDIFKVDEEVSKQLQATTVQELHDFLMSNRTHMPESVGEALKDIQ